MKSIANQYRDLKEGRMTQSNFMRNLRMSMPQYITNVTSFNDAVKILKNKGILTESHAGNEQYFEYAMDVAQKLKDQGMNQESILVHLVDDMDLDNRMAQSIVDQLFGEDDEEDEMSDLIKRIEQEEDELGPDKYKFNDFEGGLSEVENTNLRDPQVVAKIVANKHGAELKPLYDEYKAAFEQHIQNIKDKELSKAYNVLVKKFQNSAINLAGNEMLKAGMEKTAVSNLLSGYGYFEDWIQNYISDLGDILKKEDLKETDQEKNTGGKKISQELDQALLTFLKGIQSKSPTPEIAQKIEDQEAKMKKDYGSLEEGRKKQEPKKELHPNQIHPQELRMGIKIELEHTDDLDKAKKIALDHLAENPFYYTALKLSGIESPSAPKVKAPVEKKAKKKKEAVELVDKANAMQKVKMPKVVKENLNEAGGEFMFSGTLTDSEAAELRKIAPGIEIEQEELDDTYKTVVSHPMYNEKTLRHAVKQATGQLPQKKQFGDTIGYDNILQSKLEALVREILAETFDGRDNLTDLDEENKLSPEEQQTLDDLLAVNEGFGDLLNKIKEKAKKGLITAAVLGALLSSSNYSQAQQQQIKQIAGVEMQQQKGGDISKMSNQEAYDYVFNLIKKNPDGALKQLQQFKGTSQEDKNDANMLTTFANSIKSNKPIEDKDYMGRRFKMASNVVKTLTGATQQTAKYKEFY